MWASKELVNPRVDIGAVLMLGEAGGDERLLDA